MPLCGFEEAAAITIAIFALRAFSGAKNDHCLIDEDSRQPAAKSTFMVKLGRGIGGYSYAVLHSNFGLVVIAEHAVCD